jgi:two-component system CheB/CheR fusion protein
MVQTPWLHLKTSPFRVGTHSSLKTGVLHRTGIRIKDIFFKNPGFADRQRIADGCILGLSSLSLKGTLMNNDEAITVKPEAAHLFPIVALGASAGGLEAFELFFKHMPPLPGMGFVLVSHLDPGHVSILTEILQRSTLMPVVEVQDQMKVAANHVYVIPPNRDMAIFHGALQLSMPVQPRGQRMPIDAFLRSLADDQGDKAVGIILSGTGTDGTQGLRAILGAGGVTLVQEPDTAKYTGMPESAIQAGFATRILPVDKMPDELLSGLHAANNPPIEAGKLTGGMNRILQQLRSATGHDFSLYKKSTIGRRIERRMALHGIGSLELYARYLKVNTAESGKLFKELLINVTNFFRDPEAFDALKNEGFPLLLKDKPEGYVIRVWVAGCSTGEEAYSIAILLTEYMEETQQERKVLLFATDLDTDAIAVARGGFYPPNIVQDISTRRLQRYFVKEEAGYRVKKSIRELVVFATQNVIKDPPFTRLDLLSCRNLMIYLEAEVQGSLIPAFHYALKPGGLLFLSPSESIGNFPDLFSPVNRKFKLYKSSGSLPSANTIMSGKPIWTKVTALKTIEEMESKPGNTNFAELARRALLQFYAPASVVTDEQGIILYVYGDTGHYLRPAPGQATLSIIDMARDGLQLELRRAIHDSNSQLVQHHEVILKNNDKLQSVSVSVRQLPGSAQQQKYLLISFQEISSAKPSRAPLRTEMMRIEELERELAYNKENLQATIEEQQASNEELKSANEELQSTNEELQSTNEELETSKEELQSVNEELITVNNELQAKIEQLAMMQNDMKNLLDNINIATLFLDVNYCIKRITRNMKNIYRMVESDVGRPLGDINSNIVDIDLLPDAKRVLDTLTPFERYVYTLDGSCYFVRIQPYRTLDNTIDGLVITFTDMTQRIKAETDVNEARELAEGIVNTIREPLLVLDATLKIIKAGRAFYQYFHTGPADTIGWQLYTLGNGQWDTAALHELLENIPLTDITMEGVEMEHDFPVIGKRKLQLTARRIYSANLQQPLILLVMDEL